MDVQCLERIPVINPQRSEIRHPSRISLSSAEVPSQNHFKRENVGFCGCTSMHSRCEKNLSLSRQPVHSRSSVFAPEMCLNEC